MLTVVDGKLLNTRDVGNAVATMLLNGIPIDQVCDTPGMPTPTGSPPLAKPSRATAIGIAETPRPNTSASAAVTASTDWRGIGLAAG